MTDNEAKIIELDKIVRSNENIRQINEQKRLRNEKIRLKEYETMISKYADEVAEILLEDPRIADIINTAIETKSQEIDASLANKSDRNHLHSAEAIIQGSFDLSGERISGILPTTKGGLGTSDRVEALHGLGFLWGFDEAPETGKPFHMYIQML